MKKMKILLWNGPQFPIMSEGCLTLVSPITRPSSEEGEEGGEGDGGS